MFCHRLYTPENETNGILSYDRPVNQLAGLWKWSANESQEILCFPQRISVYGREK